MARGRLKWMNASEWLCARSNQKKCKHIHLQTNKNVNSRCMATEGPLKKRQENATFKTDDDSYFDWNDKRLYRSVWNKWHRENTRSKRPNAFDSLMSIGVQNRLHEHVFFLLLLLCDLHELYRIVWVYFVSTGWVIETFWIKKIHTYMQSFQCASMQTYISRVKTQLANHLSKFDQNGLSLSLF